MSWKVIDGRQLDLAGLKKVVDSLPQTTWASGMTLHNTGAPNLSQRPVGFTLTHIKNLENYFRSERGWDSAPHAFIDDVHPYNLFTKFTDKGTHSPSWNGTKLGIEMLGNYDVDDPNTGRGKKVYDATVALFGLFHTKYGWDPETIKMHHEDPKTTHACPGKKIRKDQFISDVQAWMGHAGGLDHSVEPALTKDTSIKKAKTHTPGDTLNIRASSTASSSIVGVLQDQSEVILLGKVEFNGATGWQKISAQGFEGWVAARYLR